MTITHPQPHPQPPTADGLHVPLRRFHVVLYWATFAALSFFWPLVAVDSTGSYLFILAATAAYAGAYVIPVMLLNTLLGHLLPVHTRLSIGPLARSIRRRVWLRYGVALLGGSAVILAIYADYRLYTLYQYHFNGFVWNLLTTRGGVAALGATPSTMLSATFDVSLIVAACALVLGVLHWRRGGDAWFTRRQTAAFMTAMVGLLLSVELVSAYSTHTGKEEFLEAADVIPFHIKISATGLLKKLGIERSAMKNLRASEGDVDYPGTHLPATVKARMPNVIMLVGESLRWDLLTPEIMPNLWALSKQGLRFDNHASGGNRTRMGLFSMFYGIYAPYWYSFERQRVAPALMNFLREHDYQLAAQTSQSFDYPELRNTVFAGVPEANLQEFQEGEPWRRDIRNVDAMISKLDARDASRPFYGFMFFESTHAAYSFPEDQALRKDYIKEMDYMHLNLANNIQGIHTRYINAAHHIDQQVGRLVEHIRQTGMMDNTVIMFTGDHGEEFLEKGRWGHGHGSAFPEEQIRVPLVLLMPGVAPRTISYRTSHLQIAPTLLEYLGVTAPSRSYSSADNLFTPMKSFVLGEYDYMSLTDEHYKVTFPFTGTYVFRYRVTTAADAPVDRQASQQVLASKRDELDAVMRESSRFVKK